MKHLILFLITLFFSFQLFAQSPECKPSKITVRADLFVLQYDDSGQLVQITDKKENVYKLKYNNEGKLEKLENYDDDGDIYDWDLYKEDRVENYDEDGLYETYLYEGGTEFPTKITEMDSDGDKDIIAELTWKDGNVIEEIEYNGSGSSTSYKFKYDDKPNVISCLKPLADFNSLLNYAEILSKNNVISVTTSEKVIDIPIEYNDKGCAVKMANDHHYIYKNIEY